MKLKHKNLELIRNAPELAMQFSKDESTGGKSMIRYWDWAVGHFHHEQNEAVAFKYLQNGIQSFSDTKKNRDNGERLIKKLDMYIAGYQNLGFDYISSQSRLNMDIQHNNLLTGEIFRIDKTLENGYAITLLNRTDEIWAHQLRFRLLQIHYSNLYKCPHDLVKVGVYNFIKEEHEYVSFDDEELRDAWAEITGISKRLVNNL
jgi:hypothetical protein